jgi:endonuclease/exonuclease/phosphatase family metal-dependent hydrolase
MLMRPVVYPLAFAAGLAAGVACVLVLMPAAGNEDLRLGLGTAALLLVGVGTARRLRRRPSSDAPAGRGRRRLLRRAGFVLMALVWAAVGCYLLSRIASPFSAVRVFEQPELAAAAAPTPATAHPAAVRRLRIGAYNIAHGRGTAESNLDGGTPAERAARLQSIGRLLDRADLDVVVLNEVDFSSFWSGHVDQARAIATAAGFRYWAEQRNLDATLPLARLRFGNAVLSKYPITKAELVDYPGHAAWETLLGGKKRGLMCAIELPDKGPIRVLAERIAALADDGGPPLVAAGDFNSTPPGFPQAATDAAGRTALGLLLAGGRFATLPERPPDPAGMTFSSTSPRSVIDWILATPPWRLRSVEVPPVELSDHRPVLGVLESRP